MAAQACHLSQSRAGKAETSRLATSEAWNHGRLLLVDEVLRRRDRTPIAFIENGDEVYKYVNPGEGIATTMVPSGLTPTFATPKPKRQYDAIELSLTRRFANNWFGSASYVYSRLYGNYSGIVSTDEVTPPSTGRSSAASPTRAARGSRSRVNRSTA